MKYKPCSLYTFKAPDLLNLNEKFNTNRSNNENISKVHDLPVHPSYMYMTIIFKHLLCNRMADQSQTSWKGTKVCINGQGNLTKRAAMAIN